MRWSQYFVPTLREDPADAEVISHRLLLRAGVIRQLAAGIYSYLPIGQRVALKIMQILREEMNSIGAQEFYLPALPPRRCGRNLDVGTLLAKTCSGLRTGRAPICVWV